MPQKGRAMMDLPIPSKAAAAERNGAAIRLLDAWLREDTPLIASRRPRPESDTWEQLKAELDRDRPAARKLFP